MTDELVKSLIYCRVSDPRQKIDGHGLESQEHRCRQFAATHSLHVEKVFHDDITGGGDFNQRPAMTALLSHLKQNKATNYVVIFDDIKRFSRDVFFYWGLIQKLDEYNASPMSPNFVFEKTPEGRFQQSITVAAGEYERESNARQTRQKTQARLEAGFYTFRPPVGYLYEKDKVQGKLLVQDSIVAPIVREAMEGFASGRFQTAQEVRFFLESQPNFPKEASGKLGNSTAKKILTNSLYAGYVEHKPWGVPRRKGQHEGIVSYETFCKIQERLNGRAYAPTRRDLNKDFPMRGSVACECGNALTAAWSKSHTGKYHPYYVCQNRKCAHKGKSIRRDVIEGEFEDILKSLSPSRHLITIANGMFRTLWERRAASQKTRKESLERELKTTDAQIEKLLDHIVAADSGVVVKRLEKRVCELEDKKRVLEEKLSTCGRPLRPFDQMYRTAMIFLQNPSKIWQLGGFDERRAVIKLAFTDRLIYDRKSGYRTPDLSFPFRVLKGFNMLKMGMVPRVGIEPTLYCQNRILNPARLPVPPPRRGNAPV